MDHLNQRYIDVSLACTDTIRGKAADGAKTEARTLRRLTMDANGLLRAVLDGKTHKDAVTKALMGFIDTSHLRKTI